MKVSVLSHSDDDMHGVIDVFASPGLIIEYFVETYGLSQEEKREIAKQITISFRQNNNRLAYFTHQNYSYSITEHTVRE